MATLYTADGAPQEVADGDVHDAVASGKLFFPAGETVHIERDGQRAQGPAEKVYGALKDGWRIVGPEEAAQRIAQKKYGGVGQGAIAALEGAASGLTLGGSEVLEKAAGVDPEGIEGRKAAHPIASGVGGVVGALAPALVGDEISPAGMLAKAGGVVSEGIGGVAGEIARGAMEAGVYGAAEEAAHQAFSNKPADVDKILAAAGGDAIVGGGVGGLLGVIGAVGRRAAGFAGPGAVGARGVEASTIDDLARSLEARAEEDPTTIGGKVFSTLLGPEKAAAFGRLTSREGGAEWRALANVSDKEAAEMFVTGAKGVDELKNAFADKVTAIRSSIKPAEIEEGLKAVDPIGARNAAFAFTQKVDAEIARMEAAPHEFFSSTKIRDLRVQNEAVQKALGVEIVGMNGVDAAGNPIPLWGLDPKATPTAAEVFHTLDDLKGRLEILSKIGLSVPETERPAANVINAIRKEQLRPLLESEQVFGKAGAAQSRYNEMVSDALDAIKGYDGEFSSHEGYAGGKKIFQTDPGKLKRLFQNAGTPENELAKARFLNFLTGIRDLSEKLGGDPDLEQRLLSMLPKSKALSDLSKARADLAAMGDRAGGAAGIFSTVLGRAAAGELLGGPVAAAVGGVTGVNDMLSHVPAVLHVLDRVVAGQDAKIAMLAKAVAKGGDALAGGAPMAIARMLDRARFTDRTYAQPSASSQEAYARRVAELRALATDPTRLSRAAAALKPIADEHPEAAQSILAQQENALQVLMRKVPTAMPSSPLDPRPRIAQVSDTERATFANAVRVFHDPMSVLEDLAAGRLTADVAANLRAMYPALHAEMSQRVIAAVKAQDKPAPYKMRLQISTFVGAPLDPSLAPTAILTSQSAYQPPQGQGGDEGGGGGEVKLRSSQNLKSAKAQRTATGAIEAQRAMT